MPTAETKTCVAKPKPDDPANVADPSDSKASDVAAAQQDTPTSAPQPEAVPTEECDEQRRAREHLKFVNDQFVAMMLVAIDPEAECERWRAWFEQAKDPTYMVWELALMTRAFGREIAQRNEGDDLETIIGRYMPDLFVAPDASPAEAESR